MKLGQSILFMMGLCLLGVPTWATVNSSLDQAQINQDETVTLTLRLDGELQNQSPELSPLEQDFDIISRSQRSQMQIINSKRTSFNDWVITLAPKRSGDLQIPPIQVGQEQSQALTLKVRSAEEQQQSGESPDIFLTLESESPSVYVQAQLTLVLRLHYRNALQSGQLSDPNPAHATVMRLGDDQQTVKQVGNETYQVLERRYAVFADTSGTLSIPPLLFEGQIQDKSKRRRNSFDTFGFFGLNDNLKTVRVRSEALSVEIKPQAAGFTGKHWLPAQDLQLFASWQTDPPVFKVGEPITRNFTIQAKGLRAEQLPALTLASIEGLSFYPDKPQQHNQLDQNQLLGLRGEKIAMRPNKAGVYTLPEITIPWWDTNSDSLRYAKLPAEEVTVIAAAPSAIIATPNQTSTTALPEHVNTPALINNPPDANPLWFIVSILCGFGWLLTALAWWWSVTQRKTQVVAVPVVEKPSFYFAKQQLKQACLAEDASAVQQALLNWGKLQFPNAAPASLQQLAQLLDHADFYQQVEGLQQHLYAKKSTDWSGTQAWASFETLLKKPSKLSSNSHTPALPNLYPVTTP